MVFDTKGLSPAIKEKSFPSTRENVVGRDVGNCLIVVGSSMSIFA